VPSGYELVDVRSLEQGKVAQLVYSDGLFAISVFKRFPGRPGREHTETIGVYAWEVGSVLLRRGADGDVIVIADLPPNELGRIADSVGDRGTFR
jgi:negative regulator of sigma E activity